MRRGPLERAQIVCRLSEQPLFAERALKLHG